MNIFGRKFLPSKSPPRRANSLNNLKRHSELSTEDIAKEFNKIRINFGEHRAKFRDGEWVTDEAKGNVTDETISLRRQVAEFKDENNLLKMKVEILLDMLTEKSAENLLKEKEIAKLRTR